MISIIHYISARRRLEESDKTIRMLGGEREAPPMVRAQRDMIKHEMEYYQDKVINMAKYTVTIVSICLLCYTTYAVFKHVGVL